VINRAARIAGTAMHSDTSFTGCVRLGRAGLLGAPAREALRQRTKGTTQSVQGTGGLGRAGAKPFALSQPTT
jgi:hypothetical protein